VLFQLPGTWLILVATGVGAWVLREPGFFGPWTFVVLLLLAVLGEVLETASGAVGARRSGSSSHGAWLSILIGIAGATVGASIAGSLTLPWIWIAPAWLVIVLVGAVVGAAVGAILGDRMVGRSWASARRAGFGAALGRLGGTVGKLLVAVSMWLVVVVAIFV
jgi:uncharacterized protein YqgC (DUF456 family)